ncbi:uncharacterized protein LOC124911557 [Impatiens glandulifera]|uniref:uncharacterized protein LOC124911557 n=1 Tax=Impatiens glandulifera TaxID=253017 RepID=UPI001FB1A0F8|nr:uncharacterized protein LOC124911557 [Impatiens glandulifera]XP_047308016.1 uncharacterized protein LOC124911557 [Impatiens glandulifera]
MNDQSQMMNQPQMINPPPQMMMNPPQGIGQPQMMNRSYGMWPPPPQTSMDMMKFPNPMTQGFISQNPMKPRNWLGKKGNNDKRKDVRRKDMPPMSGGGGGGGGSSSGYQPPALADLQNQNRLKARRFYPKKKYNRYVPFAPRNTTSFIIRAKKSGGIADLVSPCPVTPAVLPTPNFSPSREILGDMAKEEWGVDGYGSMKGLIRLRSPGHEAELVNEDDEEDDGGSSESDVEEHLEVERRLDHDLSRFEMIYPNYGVDYNNNLLENRVDDQDTHIAQLEEENILLKERLFLMEREMGDLRRRMLRLESSKRKQTAPAEEINEEVVDSVSENESEDRYRDRDEIDNKIGMKSEVEFHEDIRAEELAEKQQTEMNDEPEKESREVEIGLNKEDGLENSSKEVDVADMMKVDEEQD